MGAGSECYSEYTAFNLFEEYLEVYRLSIYIHCMYILSQQELEDAIAVLRSAALVKQRVLMMFLCSILIMCSCILQRLVDGATGKHLGPSATQSLMLQNRLLIM